MSDSTPQRKGHRWKPGQSGNPKGPPPSGLALSEAVRRNLGPQEITEFLQRLLAYLRDDTIPLEKRSAVFLPWLERGYAKPPTAVALQVEGSCFDWSALPAETQASVMAAFAGQVAAAALPPPTAEVVEAEVEEESDG